MSAIKFLIFVAVAVACVAAAEERVKKDVLLGAAPYAYSAGYPAAYSAGYVAPAAYSAGYVAPAAYAAPAYTAAAYSAYPHAYSAGVVAPAYGAGLYRSGLYL